MADDNESQDEGKSEGTHLHFSSPIKNQEKIVLSSAPSFSHDWNHINPSFSTPGSLISKLGLGIPTVMTEMEKSLNRMGIYSTPLSFETSDRQIDLDNKINTLKKEALEANKTITQLTKEQKDASEEIAKYKKIEKELKLKQARSHISSRISEEANEMLFSNEAFENLFSNGTSCHAVTVSIDIRRSTELMLRARESELYSDFITTLTGLLSSIIRNNNGVFDKFTGDGILAFFPKFLSGEDAIVRALNAARECHSTFKELYESSKHCFSVFIKDVGLGIGIDYGTVTIINKGSELTVVGRSVVYACRFSGAEAGITLLNVPAKEEVERIVPNYVSFTEVELPIKNEGKATGYITTVHQAAFNIPKPNWNELTEKYKKQENNT